jgi:hypothetical protein
MDCKDYLMEKGDNHLYSEMSNEAKERALAATQRALTEYSLEKMAQRYLEEYKDVLSRNRKPF